MNDNKKLRVDRNNNLSHQRQSDLLLAFDIVKKIYRLILKNI